MNNLIIPLLHVFFCDLVYYKCIRYQNSNNCKFCIYTKDMLYSSLQYDPKKEEINDYNNYI